VTRTPSGVALGSGRSDCNQVQVQAGEIATRLDSRDLHQEETDMSRSTRRRITTLILAPTAALSTWALLRLLGIDLVRLGGERHRRPNGRSRGCARGCARRVGSPTARASQPAPTTLVVVHWLDCACGVNHGAGLACPSGELRRTHCSAFRDGHPRDHGLRKEVARLPRHGRHRTDWPAGQLSSPAPYPHLGERKVEAAGIEPAPRTPVPACLCLASSPAHTGCERLRGHPGLL
jgi:hypothetical protein